MKAFVLLMLMMCSQSVLSSAELNIQIEVPDLDVDPYFRPYVAIWLEDEDRNYLDTVALWYQLETKNKSQEDGKKWLKDLRQWWRKVGRTGLDSVDAVTGATRKPGRYELDWKVDLSKHNLDVQKKLILHVEASREEGGRTYHRIPLNTATNSTQVVEPEGEFGRIQLNVEVLNND